LSFFQSNFILFSLLKACFLSFLVLSTTQGESQGGVHPSLIVDKLSIKFVGVPASPAQKNAYLNREKSLSQIAEELKNDPRFERKLSQYWLQAFKIRSAVDLGAIIDPSADSARGMSLSQDIFQKSGGRDIVFSGAEVAGKRCARRQVMLLKGRLVIPLGPLDSHKPCAAARKKNHLMSWVTSLRKFLQKHLVFP
jgi:hypothetical protein